MLHIYYYRREGVLLVLISWDTLRQDDVAPLFHPEFGRFMLEATPGKPWGSGLKDLLDVEPDMKRRYVWQTGSPLPTDMTS